MPKDSKTEGDQRERENYRNFNIQRFLFFISDPKLYHTPSLDNLSQELILCFLYKGKKYLS